MERAQILMASSPRLYNMAVCHERMGNNREAIALYHEFVASPDAPVDRRARAVDRIRELQAILDEEATNEEATNEEADSTPAPPSPPSSPGRLGRAPFFATLGVTATLAITATALGVIALSLDREFDTLQYEDERAAVLEDRGQAMAIAADVFIGLTAASTIATIVLAVLTRWRGPSSDVETSAVTLTPATNGRDLTCQLHVRY